MGGKQIEEEDNWSVHLISACSTPVHLPILLCDTHTCVCPCTGRTGTDDVYISSAPRPGEVL